MGIWLQGGALVINDVGSPFDCDHCPCIEYQSCNPCDDETIPRAISVTFGYNGSSTGGFGNTTDVECLDACTDPHDCYWWECPPGADPAAGPAYCSQCNSGGGVQYVYPCCDHCSAMGGPFTLTQQNYTGCQHTNPLPIGNSHPCLWQGSNNVCCNPIHYGSTQEQEYITCPYNVIEFSLVPPLGVTGCLGQVSGNYDYWNAHLSLVGHGAYGMDTRSWANVTDIVYDISADPTPWPLDCSQLSGEPWLTFGPSAQEFSWRQSQWSFYNNCPCDIGWGEVPHQADTIQATVTMG